MYNCSVLFNDETVYQLMWHITFPGEVPVNITLNSTVPTESRMGITAELTEYEILSAHETSRIESRITIELLSAGAIEVGCNTNSDLYTDSTTLDTAQGVCS